MDIDKKNGSVKIEDTDMYYIFFGRGKKKLVVLPGLSDGLAIVKGKSMILAGTYKRFFDDYTVYMFSRKNKMPKDYSIRDMARDQVIAMKELEIEKSSVLGVSQGGMIAQYIAIDYPKIMNKLILAVTAPYANSVINNSVLGWIRIAERDDHVLKAAISLYIKHGFEECEAYYHNPMDDVIYMRKAL